MARRGGLGAVARWLCLCWRLVAARPLQCWNREVGLTFEACCRQLEGARPGGGNPACWFENYNFSSCCSEELERRIVQGLERVELGELRGASEDLFDLMFTFAPGTSLHGTAVAAWEKATTRFRGSLDREPHSLSYFEILIRSHGLNCFPEVGPGETPAARDPYSVIQKCCEGTFFTNVTCNALNEMVSQALGRGRHGSSEAAKDKYYGNLSEMWAFHHFTPSVLDTLDGHTDPSGRGDPKLEQLFRDQGEPTLGIVWADRISAGGIAYQSPKFHFGAWALSLLVRRAWDAGFRAADFFEIGAGYGSIPRFLAKARGPLLRSETPLHVRNCAVLDVRSVTDLQRWYLSRTVGDLIRQSDWADVGRHCRAGGCWGSGSTGSIWDTSRFDPADGTTPRGPLNVDFVDSTHRDLFVHAFATAHSAAEDRGVARILVAINSWHEFSIQDFLWHYNTFVAAPRWRLGVDFILYVSNQKWEGNKEREALLLNPPAPVRLEVVYEECVAITCWRFFRRAD